MSLTNSYLFGGIILLIIQFFSETSESDIFGLALLCSFVFCSDWYNAILKLVEYEDMPFKKRVFKICFVCFLITHLLGAIATNIYDKKILVFYLIALLLPLILIDFFLRRDKELHAVEHYYNLHSVVKLSLIIVGYIFLKIIAVHF